MQPVVSTAPSSSVGSSDMSSSLSSLEEEEEIDEFQSSEPSPSPSNAGDHINNAESRSHSPDSPTGDSSTPTSSDSDGGELPRTKATSVTRTHTQPTNTDNTMSQRKDPIHGLTDDDLHVSDKSIEAFREDAQPKDSPSTRPQRCLQDEIASDRKDDFEEMSLLGKAAARQKADHTSPDEHDGNHPEPHSHQDPAQTPPRVQDGVVKDEKRDLPSREPQPTEHGSNKSNTVEDGGEHTLVAKVEPRVQATWVYEAFSGSKENRKTSLKEGDLPIILDPNDYSKSCLVDLRDFCKASEAFATLYASSSAASQGCASEQGFTGVLVLGSLASESTPTFHPMPLDCSPSDLVRPVKPAQEPNARHGKIEAVKIKLEGDRKTAGSISSGQNSINMTTDWPKAYDSLLRSIIKRQRAHGVSRKDFATALPQIEGIIGIAQRYTLVHQVQSDFDSLFLGYIGSGNFWESIAQEPVRCLEIGIALKNLPVYEEAFKHLVGMSANLKTAKPFGGLPDDVQATVDRRSRELYNFRRDVNEDLLLISLGAESPDESIYPSSNVSQTNSPDAYSTVNLFRDWMAEHIGYLRDDTSRAPVPFYLCNHKIGCDTVAGFCRAIAAGKEAYLPFDSVWDLFDESFLQHPEGPELDSDVVGTPLEALKGKASKYVGGLVKSTLHLPSKDKLKYLTCVTVGPEDVPWDARDKDGEGEDSDGD